MKSAIIKSIYVLTLIMIWGILYPYKTNAQAQIASLDSRADYINIVSNHFQSENWIEGKRILDEGLKKFPSESDLRMFLGKYYYQHSNYDLARYELMEAIDLNKNNLSAKQILVNVEIETARYSSAICYINELLEANPYWKGLWMKKIEVYRLQGNVVEANRLLKRLHQIYPEDNTIRDSYIYYLEQESIIKKREGNLTEAIRLAVMMVEKDPRNEDFYISLINTCLKAGDYEQALIYSEKGAYNLPNSITLIDKKVDILASLHRFNEALSYLQLKIKEGNHRQHLEQRYSYFTQEAARSARKSDPYILYKALYEQNPRNDEAFSYIISNALSKGFYEDALETIAAAKAVNGNTKALLVKEQHVYQLMGALSKADQTTELLYQLYPDDSDIKDLYTHLRLKQAKVAMLDEYYTNALKHWLFIQNNADDVDLQKTALIGIYSCNYQLKQYDNAHNILDQLIADYSNELMWREKKASIYGDQEKYMLALKEYEQIIYLADDSDKNRIIGGYDDLATVYTKQLIENYQVDDALEVIEHWLSINPTSKMGIHYALNVSIQLRDYDRIKRYAERGLAHNPENIYPLIKLAELHSAKEDHASSLAIIVPALAEHPYHLELISIHSQVNEDYAKKLLYDSKVDEGLEALNNALSYDPDNKTLKYWKGIAFEKMKQYDSAVHYLAFYDPSPFEVKPFTRHMNFLKSKSYKNEVGLYYQRSRFGDQDVITSIATAQYSRIEAKNTYVGRVNYAGRQHGKGVQGQLEWGHLWKNDFSTRLDLGVANKFFPSYIINGAVTKFFKRGWGVELEGGYRKLYTDENMFTIVGGVIKDWDPWWFNARLGSYIIKEKYYYNATLQARFYVTDNGYFTTMGSFGSAPDIDVIDNQLYEGLDVKNVMLGLGGYLLLNDMFSVGILGSWYNYKNVSFVFEDDDIKYRNLYNISLQLNVKF